MQPALSLAHVDVWRWHNTSGTRKALVSDISWRVEVGERWALLGPNGAGKTTLLTIAAAVEFPSSGEVSILGATLGTTDLAELRQRIGFVDARDADRFAPQLTVREVIRTGATGTIGYFAERLGMLDLDRADTLLGMFGLGQLAERRFGDLSQGERKRALIARALMSRPRLLLLDEPGAGLDLQGREILLTALARLAHDDPTLSIVTTTHHLEELPGSTTHALLLRNGVLLAAGAVDETLTDALLTSCFGISIAARRNGDRWSAVATGS